MLPVRKHAPRALALLLLAPLYGVTGACVSSSESSRVESAQLLREGDDHFRRNDHDQALASYLLAVKGAVEEKNRALEASALAQVALVYALDGDEERAQRSLDRAAAIAQKKEPDTWCRFLLARGAVERAGGDDETALATYEELYAYASGEAQLQRAAQAAHMGGLIALGDDRVDWAQRGIDTAEASGLSTWLASAWLALAWVHEDLGRHRDALSAFAAAKRFAERTSSEDAVLQADWALAHGHRMAGNKVRARDLAERTLARAQTAFESTGGEFGGGYPEYALWVAQCQRELAELAVLDQQYETAVDRFQEARRYFILAGMRERAPESLAVLDQRVAEIRTAARR